MVLGHQQPQKKWNVFLKFSFDTEIPDHHHGTDDVITMADEISFISKHFEC